MKKITLATMGLCMLTITSCGTSQGNGALIGTGAGAALGAIVGKIAGNTAVGAAIGGAVGAGTGAIIGRHMDKVKAEAAAKVQNAKVEEVTDANGLKAVKLTFDSGLQFDLSKSTLRAAAKKDLANFATVLKNNATEPGTCSGCEQLLGFSGRLFQPVQECCRLRQPEPCR